METGSNYELSNNIMAVKYKYNPDKVDLDAAKFIFSHQSYQLSSCHTAKTLT